MNEKQAKRFRKLKKIVSPEKHYFVFRKYFDTAPVPNLHPFPVFQKEFFLLFENPKFLEKRKKGKGGGKEEKEEGEDMSEEMKKEKKINFEFLMLLGGV